MDRSWVRAANAQSWTDGTDAPWLRNDADLIMLLQKLKYSPESSDTIRQQAVELYSRLETDRQQTGYVLFTEPESNFERLCGHCGREAVSWIERNLWGSVRCSWLIPLLTLPSLILSAVALVGYVPSICCLSLVPAICLQITSLLCAKSQPFCLIMRTFETLYILGNGAAACGWQCVLFRYDVRCLFSFELFMMLFNHTTWDAWPPTAKHRVISVHKPSLLLVSVVLLLTCMAHAFHIFHDAPDVEVMITNDMRTTANNICVGTLANTLVFSVKWIAAMWWHPGELVTLRTGTAPVYAYLQAQSLNAPWTPNTADGHLETPEVAAEASEPCRCPAGHDGEHTITEHFAAAAASVHVTEGVDSNSSISIDGIRPQQLSTPP